MVGEKMFSGWLPLYSFCFTLIFDIQNGYCAEVLMPCNKTAVILAPDELDEIEFVTAIEILRKAKINVTIAGEFARIKNILTDVDLSVVPHISLKEIYKYKPELLPFDVLVAPGGKGHNYILDNKLAMKTIKKHLKKNKIVGLIGEAPRILKFGKFCPGRKITCSKSVIPDLLSNYIFTGETTTVDGNLITSISQATAMEFALTIVEKLLDAKTADFIANELGYKYKSVLRQSVS